MAWKYWDVAIAVGSFLIQCGLALLGLALTHWKHKAWFGGLVLFGAIFTGVAVKRGIDSGDRVQVQLDTIQKTVKDDNSAILRFLSNPPSNLTKEEVNAVVATWAKAILDKPQGSPVSNNDLRQETAAYTNGLREFERKRSEAYSMTLKPLNLQPGAQERSAHAFAVYKQVEDDFRQNYLEKGLGLRRELTKKLNLVGPPRPSILDGQPFPTPELGRPFNDLADYLDGLAK